MNIFPEPFEAAESRVTFIAMIHIGLNAQRAQGTDAAHTEQHLLFQPIFPVAAVELVRHLPVFGQIVLIIRIEQ